MLNNPSKKENLKAIRGCIKHWMLNIRRPIKRGVGIETIPSRVWPSDQLIWAKNKQLLKISSENCQLCWLYNPKCDDCPLSQVTGYACPNEHSPYNNFITNPGIITANDMVRALIYTYWAVMEE